MATTLLSAGADTYNIYIKLDGALGAGAKTTQKGNLIDGGAGIDTLNIDDTYLGNYSLSATAAGVITITTQSGSVTATNFEKITFKNAGTIILGTDALNDTITGTAKNDGILFGMGGNDSISGLAGNDIMYGGSGNDTLDGGVGTDSMYGGLGDDIFIVDVATDVVSEALNEGTDTVQTALASYTLGANVENLTYTAAAAFTGKGNALNNTITGGVGTSDTYVLTGTAANYTFTSIDATHVQITDNRGAAGDGTDIIVSIENIQFGTATPVTLASLLIAPFTGTTGADTITGTTGADTMIGLAGDDTYTVDNVGDVVTEALNEGTDTVNVSLNNYTLGANVENLTLLVGVLAGNGNALANTITGNASDNVIDGGVGADTMIGGAGNDTYAVDNASDVTTELAAGGTDTVNASVSHTLGAEVENLVLTGAALNGTGNALANTITGNASANTLDGGAGADTMIGGAGDDLYIVDNAGDLIAELTNGGTNDRVQASVSYTLAAEIEKLALTGSALNGTGNNLANGISGNSYDNILDGGAGADAMAGDLGNDTFIVDDVGDVVSENAGEGTDTVQASVSYTLVANVENLTLTGAALNGTGNALANTITGNASANTLDGGVGADTMAGGAGNDTYVVDNAGDVTTELANGGTDTVNASIDYTIGAEMENLVLTGAALNATGNALANSITGNASDNVIDGGAGADTMIGGAGNDTYVVDNASDVTTELAAGGTDTVNASVDYTLNAEVENLVLMGAALAGTGNANDNIITGNASNNAIDGGVGSNDVFVLTGARTDYTYTMTDATHMQIVDTRAGGDGTDVITNIEMVQFAGGTQFSIASLLTNLVSGTTGGDNLVGSTAGDTLDGGLGADTMAGGLGDDIYMVDNAGDVIVENAGEGTETVQAAVSFALAANVENLTMMGTAANGTGNDLANVIIGNASDNLIDGGTGADTMTGGAGNDTYVVDNAGDTVAELAGEGTDTVQAAISYVLGANLDNLTLTGAAANGTGNTLVNVITGNAGNNILDGGADAVVDTLSGGLGNDTYVLATGSDTVVDTGGIDTITSTITRSLAGYTAIENLTLLGAAAVNGTGNALANTITGNAAANIINGGLGADRMAGGAGNDTYYVDSAADVITEALNAGTDSVISTVTHTLGLNVEYLTLAGVAAINGTGNALANTITGNAAANIINGGLGLDTMKGGLGNDTYVVSQTTDIVTELLNQGTDTVQSVATYVLGLNVENLTLTGAAVINGTGNALNNVMIGNAAANIITGGLGHDTMTGGLGRDVFDFNLITETTKVATTRDFITDFTHLTDRVDLSTIDSNTKLAGNQAFAFLAAKGAAFTGVAGQLHYIAQGVNTVIEGDINGDKIADFQIQLNGIKVLTAADFVL
jgi:Ca2+-binding RTX toxin-like protein